LFDLNQNINIMAESHLVKLIPSFVGDKRAEIKSALKTYFLDNGLLCKHTHPLLNSIHFLRSTSGAEIDF